MEGGVPSEVVRRFENRSEAVKNIKDRLFFTTRF